MAPREPFKVHSLSKHIEDTKKGLSAEAQYNRRPAVKSAAAVKKEPVAQGFFANNSDSDESSDSDSDSDDGSDYIKRLLPAHAKAPAKAPATAKATNHDEIADSDAERTKKTGVKKEPESSGTSDSSDSDSDSDASANGTKTNGTNGVSIKKEVTSSSSDSGSDSESDSESESESESDEPATAKAAAKKPEPEPSSSSSESESDSESESEAESVKAVETVKPAVNGTTTSSSGTSESDTSEESDSDSDEESGESAAADESIHMADRTGREVALPNFIAPDFVLRKGDDGSDVARVCSQANTDGKQVWYFTVPANVPISVIQDMEIPMDQGSRGERVFSHGGEDYGVSFESMAPKSSIQILVPSADSSQYQRGKLQVLTATQMVQANTAQHRDRSTSSCRCAASRTWAAAPSAPRRSARPGRSPRASRPASSRSA